MLRLKRLAAKGCRGIVDGPVLHFEPAGLLLCGDNGTGKSSFVDAIEKVLTGKCSSLDIGDQGVSWSKHGAHVDSTRQPEIELTLSDGGNDITLTPTTNPSTVTPVVQTLLSTAAKRSFILRRRTMLNFIDAKPQDRYKAVESFLNLDAFTQLEENISRLIASVQARHRAATDTKRDHENRLRAALNLSPDAPLTQPACFDRLNTALAQAELQPIASVEDAQSRLPEVETLLAPFTNIAALQDLQALSQRVFDVPPASALLAGAQRYAVSRHQALDEESRLKGHFYTEVMEKGLAWIQEDSLDHCPLCNNRIDPQEVMTYVKARLAENKRLTELREAQARAHREFSTLLSAHRDALHRVRERWADILGTAFPSQADAALSTTVALVDDHSTLLPPETIASDIDRLNNADLDAVVALLSSEIDARRVNQPDGQRYENLYNARLRLLTFSTHWLGINAAEADIQRLQAALDHLNRVSGMAELGR